MSDVPSGLAVAPDAPAAALQRRTRPRPPDTDHLGPPITGTETRLDRYICVHGHFYQPPRENPWLEVVERQDPAYPFHDWNERITAECYAPNARARILDDAGRITRVANNYAWLSFNVGPTLLAWMQSSAPDTYRAILDADQRSAQWFGGHGSAMAQVFNHVLMPLQTERDQRTQLIPRHHAAADGAGSAHAAAVGHRGLPVPVRARPRGDVAGGDRRR